MIEEALTKIHIISRINSKAVHYLIGGPKTGTTHPWFWINPICCNKGDIRAACKSSSDTVSVAQHVISDAQGTNKGHPSIQLVNQLTINPDNQSLCPIAFDEHI